MKLETIIIEDYKSIENIEWKIAEQLTCLVGQNESGKSNLLEVFNYLDFGNDNKLDYIKHTRRSSKNYIENQIPIIKFIFDIDRKTHRFITDFIIKHESLQIHLINNNVDLTNRLKKIKLVVEISYPQNKIYIKYDETSILIDPFIKDVSPVFYNTLFENCTRVIRINELLNLNFSSTLQELKAGVANSTSIFKLLKISGVKHIENLPETKVALNQYLNRLNIDLNKNFIQKYYTQDKSINFKFTHDSGEIYLEIIDGNGSSYLIEERSEGFKYYFNLLIEMAILSEGDNDIIFLLDEPGLRLHPSGQRDLLKYLEELSEKYRIIYSTHSPFLINRLHPNRVIIIERDKEKGTLFKHKGFSKNWKPMRSALGINIKDSFYYSEKALIVEGPEDLIFLSSLILYFNNKNKIRLNTDLFSFIDAGTEGNLPAMVQIIIDDERPTLVLIDSDSTSTFNRLKKKVTEVGNPNVLDLLQINEFDKNAVSIEDLLPYELLQQAVINYCSELVKDNVLKVKNNGVFFHLDLSKIQTSRYKNAIAIAVKDYYIETETDENVWNNKKVPISKVGIARHFELLLKDYSYEKKEREFNASLNLVKKISEKLNLLISN